jgi:hypothetical protein
VPPPVSGTQNNATGTGNVNTGVNPTGGAASTRPIPPSGNEGSTGGAASSANSSSTGPATTGTVSGVNRRPGEPSAIQPTQREEELFREGERLEQKAREGICSTC